MGPRIQTERLLMRLPEIEDAPAFAEHAGDYDIAKMTARIPHPYPLMSAELWVLITRASWQPGGNLALAVTLDDQMIGCAGVFKRTPDADWEIGYWLGKPWWGQGLGTEIARGLIAYAQSDLGATRLIAGHYDDNPASGRLLEKVGFHYTGEAKPQFALARMGCANCLEMVWEAAA